MMAPKLIDAVLVAAGRGLRAGGDAPKQFRLLAGEPVVRRAAAALRACTEVRRIVAVGPDGALGSLADVLAGLDVIVVAGGAERSDSVRAGLAALAGDPPDAVLVHDAARPGLPSSVVTALVAALAEHDGAAPVLAVPDTVRRAAGGRFTADVDRDGLVRVQTPQAFRYAALRAAYAAADGPAGDDVAIAAAAGLSVATVTGDARLMKLTWPEDFAMLERMLAPAALIPRTGFGVDAHRFGPGTFVTLCGVEIPHEAGLVGHSDADAAWHALADAIYGALAEGDIGRWFPPSDPQWKGAPSRVFLAHAAGRVAARGGRIVHADVTVICERPRIGPYREAMVAATACVLGVDPGCISVKATTTEAMGFTGRREGLATQAVATILLPEGA
jgi:2-C-methyl-D-erythritol 4-phosphate cytidylyltransferase / 2-C-methyl-D-erythritol 2,4-cyclodiphosphate synthase